MREFYGAGLIGQAIPELAERVDVPDHLEEPQRKMVNR